MRSSDGFQPLVEANRFEALAELLKLNSASDLGERKSSRIHLQKCHRYGIPTLRSIEGKTSYARFHWLKEYLRGCLHLQKSLQLPGRPSELILKYCSRGGKHCRTQSPSPTSNQLREEPRSGVPGSGQHSEPRPGSIG